MHDTHITMERKIKELLAQKSSEEKLEMGCSMFMFAKTIVRASIEKDSPIHANKLRQQLFLRFYGNDFDKVQKKKIIEHLGGTS